MGRGVKRVVEAEKEKSREVEVSHEHTEKRGEGNEERRGKWG